MFPTLPSFLDPRRAEIKLDRYPSPNTTTMLTRELYSDLYAVVDKLLETPATFDCSRFSTAEGTAGSSCQSTWVTTHQHCTPPRVWGGPAYRSPCSRFPQRSIATHHRTV